MYAAKDMATLAPHLSRHPKGICKEELFWLEERWERVRGKNRVPGREEPHKLRGSTKSRKEQVRPRARNDRDVELNILNAYIEPNLANGFMQRLLPPPARILFAKKNDSRLRLCVDYPAVNKVISQ
jgi:hypothetical protein